MLGHLQKRAFARLSSFNELAERMKGYEKEYQRVLDSQRPYLIRADGHRFSKFTSPFDKPLDSRITVAMERTALDAMHYLNARAVFTFSDEITFAFAPPQSQSAMFGGKVSKLVSVTAGYLSARFNHHITSHKYEPHDKAGERAHSGSAHFDARVFSPPSYEECLENLVWRSADCLRNSVTSLGRIHYTSKQMQGISTSQLIKKLKEDVKVDWNDYPNYHKYGSLIKRCLVEKKLTNPHSGELVSVNRAQYARAGMNVLKEGALDNEEVVATILFAKYVNQPDLPEEPSAHDLEQAEEQRAFSMTLMPHFFPLDYDPKEHNHSNVSAHLDAPESLLT
jgi:tRNA(His) guanylyltransferase